MTTKMTTKTLTDAGYRKHPHNETGVIGFYQKLVRNEKGALKYGIDVKHWGGPVGNYTMPESFEFRSRLYPNKAEDSVDVTLHQRAYSLKEVEEHMEKAWVCFGSKLDYHNNDSLNLDEAS